MGDAIMPPPSWLLRAHWDDRSGGPALDPMSSLPGASCCTSPDSPPSSSPINKLMSDAKATEARACAGWVWGRVLVGQHRVGNTHE
eukprot:422650-Prymnesium_polylepis.2